MYNCVKKLRNNISHIYKSKYFICLKNKKGPYDRKYLITYPEKRITKYRILNKSVTKGGKDLCKNLTTLNFYSLALITTLF